MILIVDFGSQTAHLIGRRLRQLGVSSQYVIPEEAALCIETTKPRGIILSGGPASVYEAGAPTLDVRIFKTATPVLGICYGWQLMAHLLGGKVENTTKEYGLEEVEFRENNHIYAFPHKRFKVIMSHGDSVIRLPPGFIRAGSTKSVPFTAVYHTSHKLYGVQFHPEAHHTTYGINLFEQFALLCGETLTPITLSPNKIIDDIAQAVGKSKVICAVSGGVDSTVAAFLIGKAIGKQLIPVYVENGLMRPETDTRVKFIFTKLIRAELVVVEARKRFLNALQGLTDPEHKRKAIGKLYVDIFQEIARKHKDAAFLGQGTIYSDVIESKGSKHASHIKSHHNVGGLPATLKLRLIEPLRNFYKDEVREIGRIAGLPENVINQQPFPGPGYAVRIRGKVTPKRLKQVIQADMIVLEEIKKAGLFDTVFQCFAVMTGAFSTAVKGDGRVFAEVIGIRAYESADIMTSQWAKLPYDLLSTICSRIVNEVPHVSRVVYDITTKPPATMEWE